MEKKVVKKSIYSAGSDIFERNSLEYQMNTDTCGYALVPLEELSTKIKDRYAIIPPMEAYMLRNSSLRLSKSHDNLDLIPLELTHEKEEDSFTSLPAFTPHEDSRKLISAFSSDFINKSMILVDQNSMQRYTIVPTDDDEEVVDSNHEIIEMCNGRVHRYAVIPTDDEMEPTVSIIDPEINTSPMKRNVSVLMCDKNKRSAWTEPKIHTKIQPFEGKNEPNLSNKIFGQNDYIPTKVSKSYSSNTKSNYSNMNYDIPVNVYMPGTPTKNPIATQKLHELLSTPRKNRQEMFQRQGSYQTIIQRSPDRLQLQKLYGTQEQSGFTPQKLEYDERRTVGHNIEHRSTAIISPRLHQQVLYNKTTLGAFEKSSPHESFQKVENATATIGVISLMLILTGVLNSGLCLYMVTDVSIMAILLCVYI